MTGNVLYPATSSKLNEICSEYWTYVEGFSERGKLCMDEITQCLHLVLDRNVDSIKRRTATKPLWKTHEAPVFIGRWNERSGGNARDAGFTIQAGSSLLAIKTMLHVQVKYVWIEASCNPFSVLIQGLRTCIWIA